MKTIFFIALLLLFFYSSSHARPVDPLKALLDTTNIEPVTDIPQENLLPVQVNLIHPDTIAHYNSIGYNASMREFIAAKNYHEAYWKYHSESLINRADNFSWQYISNKIIFVMVLVIVFAGLAFSGMQFYLTFRSGLSRISQPIPDVQGSTAVTTTLLNETDKKTAEVPAPVTTFKISSTSLEVSSSTLGILILTISIVFFYIYIYYVYPIQEVATKQ
jgi:hypothetical protein